MFCSQVYGVATFYHFINLKPQGKHTCVVYLGTAASINGAAAIVKAIQAANAALGRVGPNLRGHGEEWVRLGKHRIQPLTDLDSVCT
jgi:NADH:ubiquinone oxidoreductase subunit E